ncbi:CpXC domain-containing protein [Bellilinea sp.]|uniref:CpXC domain-containing protein n=1 Tax=Bellilinea sp. TaxID=2838785 RepID=UPI002ADDDE27|nr:CpXC domain-containing protein [Bellilinea sp.]
MAKIQTQCPRCKAPVVTEIEQLFDLNVNPQAKQRLLSGQVNVIHCPACGYEGMLGTPIVYHDPEKELLLTFVPSELGLPANEQEKLIGPLLNQVMNKLPPEKRKAYLLRPQTMFTFQTLIERVLEADGITRQMIDEQQKRLNLLQRILSTPQAESRLEIIKQEEALIDASMFSLLTRLIESALAQGDERGARVLAAIQKELLDNTTIGQEIKNQSEEAQQAVQMLQEAAKEGFTRQKLLDLVIQTAESDVKLSTIVSMTRNGMDYTFFQMLAERIEQASDEEKTRLENLRQKLLDFTRKVDEQIQLQLEDSRKLLNQILAAENVETATQEHLGELDAYFVEVLQQELNAARSNGDLDRIAKLQQVNGVLEQASAPPPELALIEQLLEAPSYDERMKLLQEKSEMVTPEFVQMLSALIAQSEEQQPPEVVTALKEIYRIALRVSMMSALNQ